MRLRDTELNGIKQALAPFLESSAARLFLFGSRVDDRMRGGDIDLLLLADPSRIAALKDDKISMLTAIKKQIGERRIDLTIAEESQISSDPFLKMIFPTAILLAEWPVR